MSDKKYFAVLVNNEIYSHFDIPSDAEAASVMEIPGTEDLPVGTKFNPETKAFYSDIK